jgi:hypothetical protein
LYQEVSMMHVVTRAVCLGILCVLPLALVGCGPAPSEKAPAGVAAPQPPPTRDAEAGAYPTTAQPTQPPTAADQAIGTAPAAVPTVAVAAEKPAAAQAVASERPSWVDHPGSFFKEPRDDLILAVGWAPLYPPRSKKTMSPEEAEKMARIYAATDARAKLSHAFGTTEITRTETKDEAGKVIESTTRETHQGILAAPEELASWTSPNGQFYVLMAAARARP